MKIFGLTNQINHKDLAIFMYDFDNVSLYDVLEETNFLSQVFDIDIYVLESSKNSYHLISFDILTKEMISIIQNWITIESDYINIKDIECMMFNILRLGEKGNKKTPKFVKVFYAENNKHLKSKRHYNVYRKLCNIPELEQKEKNNLINCSNDNLIMYNSHKCEKKVVINKKWIL